MQRPRALLALLKPSLMARVALALGLVGLLPVGYSTLRLTNLTEDAITEQVRNTHVLAARTSAESVGEFLASRISLAAGLAANAALAEPRSDEAGLLLSRDLQAWVRLGVLGLAVVTPQGGEVIRAQLADVRARRLVEAAIARPPAGPVMVLHGERPPVLRVEAELASGAGRLWLVAEGSQLEGLLDAFETGREAVMVLATPEGEVLAGSLDSLAGFPAGMLAQAFSSRVIGVHEELDGDERFIGAFASVPDSRWVVLSREPLEPAHRVSRQMRAQAGLVLAATLALIGALLAFAYVSLVRPIRQLVQAQRRLAGARPGAAGGDEIEQLQAAFESLERSLNDREIVDEVFLGRYKIVEVIGSGAMGTVFKAVDPKLQREVALKTVRLGKKLGPKRRSELVSQLLKEAVTVARFSHPNIVAVYDVEDRPEGAFVAMEFVDGISLEALLWRVARLDVGIVVPLGAAIARGLAAAHEHGIVHRDVKPANILLGENGSIKVTDFGIAELLSSMSPEKDVVFGTPGYLAPEVLQGKGYGRSADLFALGVILFFCLSGRRPFKGKTVKEVIRHTLFGAVPPVRRLEPRTPPEVEALIAELMQRDPDLRPSDPTVVAERLERVAREQGHRWQLPAEAKRDEEPSLDTVEAQFIPTTRLPPSTMPSAGRGV